MKSMTVPALLLDNEALRNAMRQRESAPALDQYLPVIIERLIKSNYLKMFEHAIFDKDVLRQLHWELGSSTQLRPIAKILNTSALLPDPFTVQGGIWCSEAPLPKPALQHSKTHLFTSVRLDLLLNGNSEVVIQGKSAGHLQSGDACIADVGADIAHLTRSPAYFWTAFYYSPIPCHNNGETGTTGATL